MTILYVAMVGQAAAANYNFWIEAKDYCNYIDTIAICSANLEDQTRNHMKGKGHLICIESAFHGIEGYSESVESISKKILEVIHLHESKGVSMDEVVINTSGGTEKMSCIIKDVIEVVMEIFPYITHIWGAYVGYKTIYTVKPKINIEDMVYKLKEESEHN